MAAPKNLTGKNVKAPSEEGSAVIKNAAVVSSNLNSTKTVRSFFAPVITDATYDAATGTLVVNGTDFPSNGGDDVDVSKLTIQGDDGDSRQLTPSNVAITSASSFTVVLNGADKEAVNKILNKNGLTSTGNNTAYNLAAAPGFMKAPDGAGIDDMAGNAITVSNVAVPTITDATYDVSTGKLVVTGTGFLAVAGSSNDINVTNFNLKGEGVTLNLTGAGAVDILSSTSFEVTLTGANLAAVNLIFNKNGTSSTNGVAYNLEATEDWNEGADPSTTVTVDAINAITVSGVAVPSIATVSYDAASGVLTATGTGFLTAAGSNNDINALKLTIVGEGGAYTLTGGSVDVIDATTFNIGLKPADKNRINLILNKNGSSSTNTIAYNLIASEDWNAGADAAVPIVDAVTPITVSNVAVPAIASVSYNASTGILTATGSGFLSASGSNNDIDALKLTFVGEGGAYTLTGNSVDVISTTSFAIGLNATDKNAINLIFNKNGNSSTNGTTYNLVASEDWNAGADA
ncbi:DUF4214 domain-containing protein, partial [Sediminibacterium roseum]